MKGTLFCKALAVAVMLAHPASRAFDSLSPGSDAGSCLNMLAPGSMRACTGSPPSERPRDGSDPMPDRKKGATEATHRDPSMRPDRLMSDRSSAFDGGGHDVRAARSGVSEQEIDDFLASYGKPPRSAVRALLYPTDENIAAMRAEQMRRELVAAYIAQRMTEMQQAASGVPAPSVGSAYTVVPYLIGTRIVAYASSDCASCDRMYRTLRDFVRDNPAADVQLALVAAAGQRAPLDGLLARGVPLPAVSLSSDQVSARGLPSLPVIEIDDMRNGHRLFVPPTIDAQALRGKLIELRRERR